MPRKKKKRKAVNTQLLTISEPSACWEGEVDKSLIIIYIYKYIYIYLCMCVCVYVCENIFFSLFKEFNGTLHKYLFRASNRRAAPKLFDLTLITALQRPLST